MAVDKAKFTIIEGCRVKAAASFVVDARLKSRFTAWFCVNVLWIWVRLAMFIVKVIECVRV